MPRFRDIIPWINITHGAGARTVAGNVLNFTKAVLQKGPIRYVEENLLPLADEYEGVWLHNLYGQLTDASGVPSQAIQFDGKGQARALGFSHVVDEWPSALRRLRSAFGRVIVYGGNPTLLTPHTRGTDWGTWQAAALHILDAELDHATDLAFDAFAGFDRPGREVERIENRSREALFLATLHLHGLGVICEPWPELDQEIPSWMGWMHNESFQPNIDRNVTRWAPRARVQQAGCPVFRRIDRAEQGRGVALAGHIALVAPNLLEQVTEPAIT
jgi:hypothetical protein